MGFFAKHVALQRLKDFLDAQPPSSFRHCNICYGSNSFFQIQLRLFLQQTEREAEHPQILDPQLVY